MSRHDELDSQLPWIQIHRSVGAKAAALAARCGADYYRVRGCLEAFWESLADRRVLQRALSGPGCVILAASEVESRLCRIISATCTPADVEAAGFIDRIEPEDEPELCCYRVRGMSRYLDAERTRLARRKGPTSVAPHSDLTPTPTPPPTPPGSNPTEERGERREVRGERREGSSTPPLAIVSQEGPPAVRPLPETDLTGVSVAELHQNLTPPTEEPDAWSAGDFWRWAQVQRRDVGKLLVQAWPRSEALRAWWAQARAVASVQALQEAFLAFGDDPHWQTVKPPLPWASFQSQWAKYLPQGGAHAAAR